MSIPAPEVDGRPVTIGAPARTRATPVRAGVPETHPTPRPRPYASQSRRGRPGFHPTFMVFSAAIVSLLVIGVVSLNALLVQTEYQIRSAQQQATQLLAEHEALVNDVARLSSPARVAAWARRHDMVAPRDAVILPIPGSSKATTPAGTGG